MSETTQIQPKPGVSIYTGLGQAPFGSDHVLDIDTTHADLLIAADLATPYTPAESSPPAPAAELAPAVEHT